MSSINIHESCSTGDDDAIADDGSQSHIVENTIIAKSEESSDDVNRRKKVRRMLEMQLERRRLRKEIDFYSDIDD